MDCSSFIDFKPTWNTQGPYDIRVCLRCNFEEEEASLQEQSNSSPTQSAVVLTSSADQSEPCMLQVICRAGAEVCSALILSNARHAEIHNDTDGYLRTVRGEKITAESSGVVDRKEDIIYKKEIKFDRPHASFKLKFVSLADKHHLHLHQIQVTLRRKSNESSVPILSGRHGNIDMDRVRDLLSSQQPISERAESLMNTIEQYQKNQSTVMQDLQAAVVESATNQKSGASDMGMMGQMASLLSSLSRTGSQGQVSASPDAMLKMMSSFGSGGGDSAGSDIMYGALKVMCRDVTNLRSREQQDAKNKSTQSKDQEEGHSDEERTRETQPSMSILQDELQSFLSSMEERMMARLEARLETLQAHFDLRLNRLEMMLSEIPVSWQELKRKEVKEHVEEESNIHKYL